MILLTGCASKHPVSVSTEISSSVSQGDPAAVSVPETVTEEPPVITEQIPEPQICELPFGGWQRAVSFPDWNGYTDTTLALNSMIGFAAYHDNGTIYISPDEGIEGFTLYVNETLIDTSQCVGGKTYSLDISNIVRNGTNSLQVSGVTPADTELRVRVYIPYPEVLQGDPAVEGISEDSLNLISDLITADVENGFTGASLSVIRNGRLVYENAWGNINSYNRDGSRIEDPVPATTETLYDLASVTKMFSVNYAMQKLVTDGVLKVEDRVSDYLGEGFYKDVISINYRGRKKVSIETQRQWKESLTIRDLLCHQGGFPADPRYFNPRVNQETQGGGADNVLFAGNGADDATRRETLKQICRTPLMYEPGTETLYSDVDYMILGFVIEKVTGRDLNSYLKENFWDPLKLTRITYTPLEHGFTAADCAATELNGNTRDGGVSFDGIRRYTLQGEVHDEKAYYCMAGVSGHAGLFSNATDLAKLAFCMLTGGYGNNSFFSRDVLDSFTAPKSTDYANWGLGWWREADFERVWYFGTKSSSGAFGHQGWTGTLVIVDPERDLVITYLTNKINSPLADRTKNLNKFSGSCYTSATLGFVAEILSVGMDSDTDIKEQLLDLCADMAVGAVKLISEGMRDDHPQILNAKAKADLLAKEMDKMGSDKYRELVKEIYVKTGALREDDMQDTEAGDDIILGDERFDDYIPLLSSKRVAVFSNHTGLVGNDTERQVHIVDALIERGVDVTCVFAPEHGFRGNLDAGAKVTESVDEKTNLPIYPADSKSLVNISDSRMSEFDTLIVDIQDVGTRFYTYYVSMFHLMQACARYGKNVIILDRPNPNGFYVDGPVLEEGFKSGVGLLPIPAIHGLTLGEMAKMILG
ncbi:MAG: penicillin binding protein PBP4B, partial [Lachnospiraceae bacterium]|nr:penicillin binding protein PBP4B [Lachnospiraceae bacterium]